jgi:hypothetical protein
MGGFSGFAAEITNGYNEASPPSEIFISGELVMDQPPCDEGSRGRNVRVSEKFSPRNLRVVARYSSIRN